MKYLVHTDCFEWHNVGYIVKADSKEEAKKLVEDGEGDCYYDNPDIIDQINVESVEEYEN